LALSRERLTTGGNAWALLGARLGSRLRSRPLTAPILQIIAGGTPKEDAGYGPVA
jgi:hypothetical protein